MSRRRYFSKLWLVVVLFVFLAVVAPVFGQDAEPLVAAYSQGVLQPDNSVLYSVLVFSNKEAVSGITVQISTPEDAISAEAVIAPESAKLIAEGADEGALMWEVDQLDADSVIGPFTIRVTLPDTVEDIPASLPAVVTWTAPEAGSLDAVQLEGLLEPTDNTGFITLDANGTVDGNGEPTILEIANTDIWIHVPEGAVSEPLTLTFTRLVIDDTNVPAGMDDTWWCVLVMIEGGAGVELAKPITIALPTRQVLTPGMEVQVLVPASGNEWQTLDTAAGLGINGMGTYAGVMITGTVPEMVAVGVSSASRLHAINAGPRCGGGGFNGGFNSGGFGGSSFNGGAFNCG